MLFLYKAIDDSNLPRSIIDNSLSFFFFFGKFLIMMKLILIVKFKKVINFYFNNLKLINRH